MIETKEKSKPSRKFSEVIKKSLECTTITFRKNEIEEIFGSFNIFLFLYVSKRYFKAIILIQREDAQILFDEVTAMPNESEGKKSINRIVFSTLCASHFPRRVCSPTVPQSPNLKKRAGSPCRGILYAFWRWIRGALFSFLY